MPNLTITSSNVIYLLSIPLLFPVAQQLQDFGVDEAFDTERSVTAETRLGVDGAFVAGWVPRTTMQTITLLASSPSFLIFESWVAAQDTSQDILYATGTITIPAIGRKYNMPKGVVTHLTALPNVKRVLADRVFEITWGWPITSAPI